MNPETSPTQEIQRLIRLKRYEQPPAGYYEQVLEQFRAFREAEPRRSTRWKFFSELLSELLSKVHIPAYAYATIGLFAIITSVWILTTGELIQPESIVSEDANPMMIDLYSSHPETFSRPVEIPSQRFVGTLPPHYVLQSRPSEHNEPFSF